MIIPLKAREMVLKAGDSKYCCDPDALGGKLIVTNQRIYFRAMINKMV